MITRKKIYDTMGFVTSCDVCGRDFAPEERVYLHVEESRRVGNTMKRICHRHCCEECLVRLADHVTADFLELSAEETWRRLKQ